MSSHERIEAEAKQVAAKKKPPRNVLTDPAPDIAPDVLIGILPDGRVAGYEKGVAHKGTFYIECEGVHLYQDESFLRVVMYGDEFHDKETRIPLAMLEAAGFVRQVGAPDEDGNNYCRILTILGMEEEGDPVAEVQRLFDLASRVGAPDSERDAAKEQSSIPEHLREFVEAVAHRFGAIDRETDDEFCKGCSGLTVWDGDTRQSVTHHRHDCIVLRAETILAKEKA
jgi:hypothetical protein